MDEQTEALGSPSWAIRLGDPRDPRSLRSPEGWRAEFASEVDDLFRRRLRVASSVLVILHAIAFLVFPDPTGTTLDAALRLALFPFSLLLFASTWWRGLGRGVRATSALMIVTVCAYAAWKNAKVGDPLDIRSLTLTIVTAGLLFPFGGWGMCARIVSRQIA